VSTFFTSDMHFGHNNIFKYTKRPWTNTKEMNEILIKNWNNTIGLKDRIFHLGDFCWGYKFLKDAEPILRRLNGIKFFILGNHDDALKDKAREIYLDKYANLNSFILPPLYEEKINGIGITMCHYAMRTWNKSHFGAWQLYGHSHGSLQDDPNLMSMDVGIDCHPEYRPFSFDEVKEHMSNKTFKPIERILR
jgi:calcineurin-like phosphoesterase family protein